MSTYDTPLEKEEKVAEDASPAPPGGGGPEPCHSKWGSSWAVASTLTSFAVLLSAMSMFLKPCYGGTVPSESEPTDHRSLQLNCRPFDLCGVNKFTMTKLNSTRCVNSTCVDQDDIQSFLANGYVCRSCESLVPLSGRTGTLSGATSTSTTLKTNTTGTTSLSNVQPILAVNYIISLFGIYPSRSRRLNDVHDHRELLIDPFIGEIIMFAGNFAPVGWLLCHGQLLPISEHDALFSLLGTTYGGNGQSTFALPDLRGRIPIHQGTGLGLTNHVLGASFGVETPTVSSHSHVINAARLATLEGTLTGTGTFYDGETYKLNPISGSGSTKIAGVVSTQNNMQPSLTLNCIIALQGIFPSRSRRLQEDLDQINETEERTSTHRQLAAEPILGSIEFVAFDFAPKRWALCDGQLLPINQNQALFALLGTMYGGDGRINFALPDLRGRTAVHNITALGSIFGTETTLAAHTHTFQTLDLDPFKGVLSGTLRDVDGKTATFINITGPTVTTASTGSGDNTQPSLMVNYIIALQGVYPSRARRLDELHLVGSKEEEHIEKHRQLLGLDPFIGQISIFAGNFAPRGWAFCEGQLLPISQNTALFSILGTTYGGDGLTNFALPDLKERAPVQAGQGPGLTPYDLGQQAGTDSAPLPPHNHDVNPSFSGLMVRFNPFATASPTTMKPTTRSPTPPKPTSKPTPKETSCKKRGVTCTRHQQCCDYRKKSRCAFISQTRKACLPCRKANAKCEASSQCCRGLTCKGRLCVK